MKIARVSLAIADVCWVVLGSSCATRTSKTHSVSTVRLETVPPSPVTEQIEVDIRGAVVNATEDTQKWQVGFYLDRATTGNELYHEQIQVQPGQSAGIYYRWPAKGHAGPHRILLVARNGRQILRASEPLRVIASTLRSTGRIGGAWCGIYHWSEREGRFWNPQIQQMTDSEWRDLISAMHDIGMNIVVIQEAFRNQEYVGQNDIATKSYHGKAFYPSQLYPGRMEIAAQDPIEAILSEADRLGMHVFVPVGLYAWFDFTPDSLAWHEQVAKELWIRYGHHPSFYGWYVSEEIAGNLGANESRRRQIGEFFKEFRPYLRRLAPEKPVMLASNCHSVRQGLPYYSQLLSNLDILCSFGFDRMPTGDMSGGQAAALLQKLCDQAGTHLWMDMEVFHFDPTGALIPRPSQEVIQYLQDYTNFEETLCYQFPGLMTAPWMSPKLGGERAVEAYRGYLHFLGKHEP
ncbi:MAG: DUF4434 domain-containing protein [Limisphaerales bacterium]